MSDAPKARRAEWKTALIVSLGGILLRMLAWTWRMDVVHGEYFAAAGDDPFVFALWHEHLLPLLWQHRSQGIAVLISEHSDGELIARVAHGLGYRTVRGSSTRGGSRALLGLIHELEDGVRIAVTPDGPKGPRREFQSGALIAAQRARAPILPIAASADRAWRLGSWDRFMIPKPFARVRVTYGPLTMVPGDRPREAAELTGQFGQMLNALAVDANG